MVAERIGVMSFFIYFVVWIGFCIFLSVNYEEFTKRNDFIGWSYYIFAAFFLNHIVNFFTEDN